MKSMMTLVALVAAAGSAQAATVAYWAFPSTVPSSSVNFQMSWPINADLKANAGLATIDTDAPKWDGSSGSTALQQGSMQYFAGDATNALPGFVAGSGLSMRNDSQDRAQNKSIIMRFDASNFIDLKLSFAERYSSTGPTTTSIDFSTDGGATYTNFSSYSNTRSGAFLPARLVDLSAVNSIEGLSSLYIKIRFSTFNTHIDGTSIPAPGSMALLAIGGLVAGRRRRA